MEAHFTDFIILDVPVEVDMLEPFTARVLVGGTTNLPYVRPFRARFDDENIEAINVDMSGTGFTGYLRNRPTEGAKLIVEFDGQDPIDTGLIYSTPNV